MKYLSMRMMSGLDNLGRSRKLDFLTAVAFTEVIF